MSQLPYLQRHLLKNKKIGMYLGEHVQKDSYDFEWYVGSERIGLESLPSTEAESFINGFLVRDDTLIVVPSKKYPRIARASDSYGVMRSQESGIEEVSNLIRLIQRQDITHVYQTSKHEDGHYPRILTFSPLPPPADLYVAGKIMTIKFDSE